MSLPSEPVELSVCPDEATLLSLAHAEAPDPPLQAHLEGCAPCRQRLEALQRDVRSVRQMAGAVEEAVPATIGRYRVLEMVGRGGQARIYRAVHPTLRHDVAIKLADHAPAPEDLDTSRLAAEARALCELNHPGIARVYDLGQHEGRPFVAMEYVPGRTLAQYVKEKTLSPPQAALLVAQVARALGAAHRLGITHRDVTVRNILVDSANIPRLIDFGLAFFRRANAGVKSETFEAPGSVSGTPAFMAPEQLEGRNADIGPRTDIYAVGEVLRYLLAAQRTVQMPPRLARIVDKATAARASDRYGTAEELAEALERFAAARRVAGLPPLGWAAVAALALAAVAIPFLRRGSPPPNGGGQGNPAPSRPETPPHFTRAQVLARARPAVFKVIAFGNLTAVMPRYAAAETNGAFTERSRGWRGDVNAGFLIGSSDVDPEREGPTLAENEYRRDLQAGTISKYGSKAEYCYRKIIADPARYLQCQYRFRKVDAPPFEMIPTNDGERKAVAGIPRSINLRWFYATPYAEGSAFAVGRDGTLLTNAHVVGRPTSVPQAALIEPLKRTLTNLEAQFGGKCPPQLAPALIRSLLLYLQSMSEVLYSDFNSAVVVLEFSEKDDNHARARQGPQPEFRDFLAVTPHPEPLISPRAFLPPAINRAGLTAPEPKPGDDNGMIGYPAEVVYRGQEFPGKDVAVLRLKPNADGIVSNEPVMSGGFKDRLICLPLGNSDDFPMGSDITAMGFPGVAVSLEGLKESASYRVIPQDGAITAAEPLATGWDALHMTAAIDHGHSGGPVVDHDGNVIAINVAGPQSIDGHGLAGYAVAIPINVAKQALAGAGIAVDPGPATALWSDGLRLFDERKFAEAEAKFRQLRDLQRAGGPLPFKVDPAGSGVFSAVEQMIAQCQRRQKESAPTAAP